MPLRIASILVIVSLTAIGGFGYITMDLAMQSGNHLCFFESFIGKDCAYLDGFLNIHHVSGFRQLLQFFAAPPLLFTAWALAVLAGLLLSSHSGPILAGRFGIHRKLLENEIVCTSAKKLMRWLALLNKNGDSLLFSGA